MVVEEVVHRLGMVAFAKGIRGECAAAVELGVAAGGEARVLADGADAVEAGR